MLFFSGGQFVCHSRDTLEMLPHCKSNSVKFNNKHVPCNDSGHVIVLSKHSRIPSVTPKHAKVHMEVSSTCFNYCPLQ